MKLTGHQLLNAGFAPGPIIGQVIALAAQLPDDDTESQLPTFDFLQNLEKIVKGLGSPTFRANDPYVPVLMQLLEVLAGYLRKEPVPETVVLREAPLPYPIFGSDIEAGALAQMDAAMRLPITRSGALMPDAHQGYGLPIGGVLATENAIIPYAVGVDIGCRMRLSVFDIDLPTGAYDSIDLRMQLREVLTTQTRFGEQREHEQPADDAVLASPLFREIPLLRNLQGLAQRQLGTSGGGNHFAEFGRLVLEDRNSMGLPAGEYVALMTHSGSRGFGATIADHYCKLATAQRPMPLAAQHLGWLAMDSEAGQEYWLAMNLAGDYADACHRDIHRRVGEALVAGAIASVTNAHNLAWKEIHGGRELIVHRKGATPASAGQVGIIPGSMATPAFLVRGRGEATSLRSASHGAGRCMSRTVAKQKITTAEVDAILTAQGVDLIGGGFDEAPQAYKDIVKVMGSQTELVDIEGSFHPKVVRMAPPDTLKPWQKPKVELGE